MAALYKLVSLGSCGEAGMLGTASWLLLLRALSGLERLQAALLPGASDGLPPLPEGVAAAMASSGLDAVAAATAAAAAAPPAALPPPPQPASSFGRLLQRMGFSGGAGPEQGSGSSSASARSGLLAIKDAPGAGHVLWAQTAGETAWWALWRATGLLCGKRSFSPACRGNASP